MVVVVVVGVLFVALPAVLAQAAGSLAAVHIAPVATPFHGRGTFDAFTFTAVLGATTAVITALASISFPAQPTGSVGRLGSVPPVVPSRSAYTHLQPVHAREGGPGEDEEGEGVDRGLVELDTGMETDMVMEVGEAHMLEASDVGEPATDDSDGHVQGTDHGGSAGSVNVGDNCCAAAPQPPTTAPSSSAAPANSPPVLPCPGGVEAQATMHETKLHEAPSTAVVIGPDGSGTDGAHGAPVPLELHDVDIAMGVYMSDTESEFESHVRPPQRQNAADALKEMHGRARVVAPAGVWLLVLGFVVWLW